MRDIKFRAWDDAGERFKYSGRFLSLASFFNKIDRQNILTQHSLEQFTGLTDKNGVDIYEGDIVTFTRYTGNWAEPSTHRQITDTCEIVWEDETVSFRLKYRGSVQKFRKHNGYIYEVIGNIHENKDLL